MPPNFIPGHKNDRTMHSTYRSVFYHHNILSLLSVSCQLASLQCVQCSTSTQVNTTNLMPQISLIIPSMYSPDCRVGGASSLTTPNPVFNPGNSNPRFPTMCPTNVVPENNAEFRCGYYRGHLTAKTQDQTGMPSFMSIEWNFGTSCSFWPVQLSVKKKTLALAITFET